MTDAADILDSREAGGLVLRGGILRAGGFAVGTVLSLVGVIFVTRELGPGRYGQFQTILNLLVVVQAVTDVGMATLGMREYAQRAGEARESFMRVLLGLRLVLTTVGIAVAMIIAISAGYSASLLVGTLLGGIGLVLSVAQTTLAIPLGAELRIGTITALDVARQALTAALYVGLALLGGGILAFLAVVVPVQILLLVWTLRVMRGRVTLAPSVDVRAWRGLLGASVAFALAIAVGTLYQYTAQILTSFLTDERQTGLFAASFRTYVVIAAIPGVLVATAFPLLSRAATTDRVRLNYALRKLTDAMAIGGVGVALGVGFGAPVIIDVIAGAEYADAAPVLRVHGLALLLAFAITTWGFTLLSLHRHRAMILANGLSFVIATIGVLVYAPRYGAIGTAWASFGAELVLAITYYTALRVSNAGVTPGFRVPLTAVAIGCAVALPVSLLDLPPALAAGAAMAAYSAVVIAARLIPQELLELLPAPVASRLRGSR